MKIGFLTQASHEPRCTLLPATFKLWSKTDHSILVQAGIGGNFASDQDYQELGATILKTAQEVVDQSDIIVRLHPPSAEEIAQCPPQKIHVSLLDPFKNKEALTSFAKANVTAIALDMIPRSTLAQKMDVLSSQASLAGYSAVIQAAHRYPKVFPMMMTPAGTLAPTRYFVIGAGVAGLQAIATAKRLGARVDAFDTRAVVKEQVESLGAKFIEFDLGETGQTNDGYAKQLSDDQLKKQQELMGGHCEQVNVILTTAQVFGRPAPRIITDEMIQKMTPGTLIIDMAVDSGGNVEGSEPNKEVVRHGVRIFGHSHLSQDVALDASQMIAANIYHWVTHCIVDDQLNVSDPIVEGCLMTHNGDICHPQFTKDSKS